MSGVLLDANMSNNNYDFTDKELNLAQNNLNNVIGFITQKRIKCHDMVCMTPGISLNKVQIKDQSIKETNLKEEIDSIKKSSAIRFDFAYGCWGFKLSFSVTLLFLLPYTAAVEEKIKFLIPLSIHIFKKILDF